MRRFTFSALCGCFPLFLGMNRPHAATITPIVQISEGVSPVSK